jgi:hexosaminidase
MAGYGIFDLGVRTPHPRPKKMKMPALFPTPAKLESAGGFLNIPAEMITFCKSEDLQAGMNPWIKKMGIKQAGSSDPANLIIEKSKVPHPEGYTLRIGTNNVIIEAGTPAGTFRGLSTLAQLIEQEEDGKIAGIYIEDQPGLNRRGFMLDVSRCKVPTMEELFALINLIARLGYNELQLYVEHTFAFKDHQTIWKDASPLTAEEILQIDKYCQERFIELVPNLNSFGHFERWLCHDEYKHMAECPDGFTREQPYIKRDHGTTLRPNEASLSFIDSLYAEYLPNFSSSKFNVGLDEPWELGQGWSRKEVEKAGKDKVYLRHLDGIRKLVEKHGKRMQFWADVLLENPENAKLLCPTASPIIWGYEPTHPFDEQARAIAECGLSFCLAPGVAAWRSFCGRWTTARENLTLASKCARRHGADGMLVTSWGDCGNHQPWPTLYPGLFHGAQLAWSGNQVSEEELGSALDRMVFGVHNGLGNWLLNFGKLDEKIGISLPNTSLDWWIIFAARADLLRDALPKHAKVEQLQRGFDYISGMKNSIPPSLNGQVQAIEELKWGAEISEICLGEGIRILQGDKRNDSIDGEGLVHSFEENWLRRARPGGLREASTLLKEGLDALSQE